MVSRRRDTSSEEPAIDAELVIHPGEAADEFDRDPRLTERQRAFLRAYRDSRMVAAACRVAQMSRETFYAWKRESVAFLEAWEELEEELSDIAKMTWAVGMKTDWRASQAWLERQDRLKKEAQADRLRALEGGEDADIILERGPDRFSKRSGDAGSED